MTRQDNDPRAWHGPQGQGQRSHDNFEESRSWTNEETMDPDTQGAVYGAGSVCRTVLLLGAREGFLL
jgi:hypothetical protein